MKVEFVNSFSNDYSDCGYFIVNEVFEVQESKFNKFIS